MGRRCARWRCVLKEQERVRLSSTGAGRILHSQTWFRRDRRCCWSSRWVVSTAEMGKRLYITIGNRSGLDSGQIKLIIYLFLVYFDCGTTLNKARSLSRFRLSALGWLVWPLDHKAHRDLNGFQISDRLSYPYSVLCPVQATRKSERKEHTSYQIVIQTGTPRSFG